MFSLGKPVNWNCKCAPVCVNMVGRFLAFGGPSVLLRSLVLLGDSSQGVVHRFGGPEYLGHVRVEDDHVRTLTVPACVLPTLPVP